MIRFPNLLEDHCSFSVFWKTVLERLSVADAPFFSRIGADVLSIQQECSLLGTPSSVVQFCGEQWMIPEPIGSWKNIKKDYVKILLLQDFIARQKLPPSHIMKLQACLGDKSLSGEDIVLQGGKIVDIRGF